MRLIKLGIFLLFIFLASACARYATLGGGAIDKSEPVNTKCYPQNYATQMNTGKILLTFDEYIVLKNFNDEFIMSPIFSEKPEKVLRGKSLMIKFNKDSLKPNTTYTLNFGNSIVDFRAGNVLENYEYVFSTGNYIDSLNLSGHLYKADDLSPQEKVYVMLYRDFNDSILSTSQPDFITKTNEQGYFNINHIAPGRYAIFALNDINSNYMFDLPNEQIAFLDSTFLVGTEPVSPSLTNDSLKQTKDSVLSYRTYPENIDLFLFEESHPNLYLKEYSRPNQYQLLLIYSQTNPHNLDIKIEGTSKGFVVEQKALKDTFNIWLTDSSLYQKESVEMLLKHQKTNNLGNLEWDTDTLVFKTQTDEKPKSKKELNDTLIITSNLNGGRLDFYKNIYLTANFPIKSVDVEKIHLYQKNKDDFTPLNFKLQKDSINLLKYQILCPLEENTEYKIELEPNSFTDERMFGNDSLSALAQTTGLDDYSDIIIHFKGMKSSPYIVEILDNNEKVLKHHITENNSDVQFKYLNEGTYHIKLIEDRNRNGKWDTGNYQNQSQPEKVQFFKENIELKKGWSRELEWNIETSSP